MAKRKIDQKDQINIFGLEIRSNSKSPKDTSKYKLSDEFEEVNEIPDENKTIFQNIAFVLPPPILKAEIIEKFKKNKFTRLSSPINFKNESVKHKYQQSIVKETASRNKLISKKRTQLNNEYRFPSTLCGTPPQISSLTSEDKKRIGNMKNDKVIQDDSSKECSNNKDAMKNNNSELVDLKNFPSKSFPKNFYKTNISNKNPEVPKTVVQSDIPKNKEEEEKYNYNEVDMNENN